MEKLVLTGLTTIGSLCGGGEGINNEINVEQIIEKLNNPLPAVTYQGEIPKPPVELVDIYWDNPYILSPDALSTCVVEEEVSETDKNICPTDEELVKMGLVPTEEEWEEIIEETGENPPIVIFPRIEIKQGVEKPPGHGSPLKQPENQDPEPTFDPEATPATEPEAGGIINNIAQHVDSGLAEGKKYEIRAIDEGVMFRDKAAWNSGETVKQTDWWEVIRAEGDFVWGRDSEGNEFCVSANGDSEATHLDLRPAEISDEDLGEEELGKDAGESSGVQEVDKVVDESRIGELRQVLDSVLKVETTQDLYGNPNDWQRDAWADPSDSIRIIGTEIHKTDKGSMVLVEILDTEGNVYIKKDGNSAQHWTLIDEIIDFSKINDAEWRALSFEIEDNRLETRSLTPADLEGFTPAEEFGFQPTLGNRTPRRRGIREDNGQPFDYLGIAAPIKGAEFTNLGWEYGKGGVFWGRVKEVLVKEGTNTVKIDLEAWGPVGSAKHCIVIIEDIRSIPIFINEPNSTCWPWEPSAWGISPADLQEGDFIQPATHENISKQTPSRITAQGMLLYR